MHGFVQPLYRQGSDLSQPSLLGVLASLGRKFGKLPRNAVAHHQEHSVSAVGVQCVLGSADYSPHL